MSVINEEYGHIFIHVPKTAGSSMESRPFVGGRGHQSALQLIDREKEFFSWGFVRNPYDRLVSVFHSAQQHGGKWPRLRKTFEEFVRALPDDFQVTPHARPMAHFLSDSRDRILVNFVGRFESIRSDWETVCRRIGMAGAALPHKNPSEHRPCHDYYNPDLYAIVNRVYAVDFAAFGYHQVTE